MKKLNSNDYVIYDRKCDDLLCYVGGSQKIIIYSTIEEAEADLFTDDEEIISCTELPIHLQQILLTEINN